MPKSQETLLLEILPFVVGAGYILDWWTTGITCSSRRNWEWCLHWPVWGELSDRNGEWSTGVRQVLLPGSTSPPRKVVCVRLKSEQYRPSHRSVWFYSGVERQTLTPRLGNKIGRPITLSPSQILTCWLFPRLLTFSLRCWQVSYHLKREL